MTLAKHVRSSIMEDACGSSRNGRAAAVCNCLVLHSQTSHSTRLYYILTDDIRPELIEMIEMDCQESGGVPCLCPTLVANAFRNFFQNVLCQKNVRLIWKLGWRKREKNNGGWVSRWVICRKRYVLTQQLSAKELELDVLTQEIETLTREHTEAV